MDSQPELTVVIPALDAADEIAGQLDALAAQEWDEPWEVVVADNGSTDGTRAVVERYAGRLPGLRVVDASEPAGQAHALNSGVESAGAEAVAFCDTDDEAAPGWVAAMGEALSATSWSPASRTPRSSTSRGSRGRGRARFSTSACARTGPASSSHSCRTLLHYRYPERVAQRLPPGPDLRRADGARPAALRGPGRAPAGPAAVAPAWLEARPRLRLL